MPRKLIHFSRYSPALIHLFSSFLRSSKFLHHSSMSLKVSILEAVMPHEMESSHWSQEQRRGSPLFRSRQRYTLSALVLVGCAGFFLCLFLEATLATTSIHQNFPFLRNSSIHSASKALTRPENVQIIGLMFYGRAQFTNILEW